MISEIWGEEQRRKEEVKKVGTPVGFKVVFCLRLAARTTASSLLLLGTVQYQAKVKSDYLRLTNS